MKRKNMLYLSFILALGILNLWGCPKKAEVSMTPEAQTQAEKTPAPATPATATETASTEAKSGAKAEGASEASGAAAEGLMPVYFDYDRASIRSDAKPAMKANTDFLKAHPQDKIVIEGNCDERGTKEYNVALGQRRATAAKKYLTEMGVSAGRISLLSYGKEKPVCSDSTEACWQKNRRDDFVLAP